jgi:hypothetical protein
VDAELRRWPAVEVALFDADPALLAFGPHRAAGVGRSPRG